MRHHKVSQEGLSSCRGSTTFPVGSRDNQKEWMSNANIVSLYAKRFGTGQWTFIGPVSEKKWVVFYQWRESTRKMGQYGRKDDVGIRRKRTSNFPCYKSIVQRSTQKQRPWKFVDTLFCRFGNGWDNFSHNCFCKPAQSLRSSRRDVWRVWIPSRENPATRWLGGQSSSSFVPSVIKKVPLDCDDLAHTDLLLQQYGERIWKAVTTRQIEPFFLRMQDFWLLFESDSISRRKTLQSSHDFVQWLVVNTLSQGGWIQGNTLIGPVLEIATCCLHGKYGVAIRIMSVNRDNSHSLVRI